MSDPTLDDLVEAVERARYEALLGKPWDGLRVQERTTRLDLGRKALETSGVASLLVTLSADLSEARALLTTARARQDQLDQRARELDRREADLTRRTQEQARLAHDAVAAARADAAAHAARADTAEDVIRALTRASRPVPPER